MSYAIRGVDLGGDEASSGATDAQLQAALQSGATGFATGVATGLTTGLTNLMNQFIHPQGAPAPVAPKSGMGDYLIPGLLVAGIGTAAIIVALKKKK